MLPIIEELANELQGKGKVGKINVDENQDLALKYDVMSIPTLIIFKDGKEIKRFVGVRDKNELLEQFWNIWDSANLFHIFVEFCGEKIGEK